MMQYVFQSRPLSGRRRRQAVLTRINREYRSDRAHTWELERSSRGGRIKLSYYRTVFPAIRSAYRWIRWATS